MNSPYFEAVKNKDQEVLFLFEPHDETVMLILNQYKRKSLVGIEQSQKQNAGDDTIIEGDARSLNNDQAKELKEWLKKTLEKKVKDVKVKGCFFTFKLGNIWQVFFYYELYIGILVIWKWRNDGLI